MAVLSQAAGGGVPKVIANPVVTLSSGQGTPVLQSTSFSHQLNLRTDCAHVIANPVVTLSSGWGRIQTTQRSRHGKIVKGSKTRLRTWQMVMFI